MLCWLGLELMRCGDMRDKGHMGIESVLRAHIAAHLSDSFQEGETLDVTNRSAYLNEAYIEAFSGELNAALNLIGNMGNDLDSATKVVATTFVGDNGLVHFSGGEVIELGHASAHEALIVSEVEIGFATVVGHEYLSVLKRAHRARIDVNIRVELNCCRLESTSFEQRADARCRKTFSD